MNIEEIDRELAYSQIIKMVDYDLEGNTIEKPVIKKIKVDGEGNKRYEELTAIEGGGELLVKSYFNEKGDLIFRESRNSNNKQHSIFITETNSQGLISKSIEKYKRFEDTYDTLITDYTYKIDYHANGQIKQKLITWRNENSVQKTTRINFDNKERILSRKKEVPGLRITEEEIWEYFDGMLKKKILLFISNGLTYRTISYYDREELINRSITSLLNEGVYLDVEKVIYKYNKDGELIERFIEDAEIGRTSCRKYFYENLKP